MYISLYEIMATIHELKSLGEDMGLTGSDLRKFISEQQSLLRDERTRERERETEERTERLKDKDREHERENKAKDFELEQQRLQFEKQKMEMEFQLEKEKTHGKLAVLDKEGELRTHAVHAPTVTHGQKVRGPKLPPFDEATDDMDAYIRRFERYATAQEWQPDNWATHLSALLKGKALEVYTRLTPDLAMDFNALKQALLKRYEMTETGFKKRFRNAMPERGETFGQFALRIGHYFNRWIELGKVDMTFEELVDFLLRDQLLQSCGADLTLFLKEHKPKNIVEMADLADTFCDARGGNISVVTKSVAKISRDESRSRSEVRSGRSSYRGSDSRSSIGYNSSQYASRNVRSGSSGSDLCTYTSMRETV